LGDHKQGWFGETGLNDVMQVANAPLKSSMKFEQMFVCEPSAKYYGYKSWDGKCIMNSDHSSGFD
jgi:phosphatidylserine decarboxylase